MYKCRCDERLKVKAEGATCLPYTRLRGGLEHLKITRLIDERFVNAEFGARKRKEKKTYRPFERTSFREFLGKRKQVLEQDKVQAQRKVSKQVRCAK